MDLSDRLRALRLESGLSAAQLSELAGLSPAHVSIIERGERPNVAATTATALARVLGTCAEYLVDGVGDAPTADAVRAAVERARAGREQETAPRAA